MIGSTLENYRVESLLGEGGMGSVYLATDDLLGRKVAIKNLKGHLTADSTFRERFINEAKILARLSHPNIAMLYNYLQKGEDSYMVMEYVQGHSIDALIRDHGALPYTLVVPVIYQALEGLQHAHRRHVLHRDLKPANLMITEDAHVKIMDFGIARMAGDVRKLTRVKSVIGTLEYIAPELIDGKEPSEASDIYAMGVVLYEMLTGALPFSGSGEYELMKNIMGGVTKDMGRRIPARLAAILFKAMNKNPAARYTDARSFQKALQEFYPEVYNLNPDILHRKEPLALLTTAAKATVVVAAPAKTTVVRKPQIPAFLQNRQNIQYGVMALVLGLILFAAVLLLRGSPEPAAAITEPVTENLSADSVTVESTPSAGFSPSAGPVNEEPKVYTPVPEPDRPVTPANTGIAGKKPAPVTVKPQEEKVVETEVPRPEEKTPPPAVVTPENRTPDVSSVRLEKNVPVSLYLEDHLTPDNLREGQQIRFHVTAPVIYQGETLISKGAGASAVIRSVSSKKISIRFQQVTGVKGQSLKFRDSELSGKISEMLSSRSFSVQLEKGQLVRL